MAAFTFTNNAGAGNGNLSAGANWTGGSAPTLVPVTDAITINAAVCHMDTAVTISTGSVQFATQACTFDQAAAATLTISGAGTWNNAQSNFGNNYTFNGNIVISGSGTFIGINQGSGAASTITFNGSLIQSAGTFNGVAAAVANAPVIVWNRTYQEAAINLSGITWSGSVATVTTAATHPYAVGDCIEIAGVTPTGYNTTAVVASSADNTHFTYALPNYQLGVVSNPGAYSSGGTVQRRNILKMTGGTFVLASTGTGTGTQTTFAAALVWISGNPQATFFTGASTACNVALTSTAFVSWGASSGTLAFFATATANGGTCSVAAGAIINTSGTVIVRPVNVASGTITINGTWNFTSTGIISNQSFTGSGTLSTPGTFNFVGATAVNLWSVSLGNGSTFLMNGNIYLIGGTTYLALNSTPVFGSTMTITGTIQTAVTTAGNVIFTNSANAVLNINAGASISSSTATAYIDLSGLGTVNYNGGTVAVSNGAYLRIGTPTMVAGGTVISMTGTGSQLVNLSNNAAPWLDSGPGATVVLSAPAYLSYYAVMVGSTGYVRSDLSTPTQEAYNAAHWTNYALAMTDANNLGQYSATISTNLAAGIYSCYAYRKLGTTVAQTDAAPVSVGTYYWDGATLQAVAAADVKKWLTAAVPAEAMTMPKLRALATYVSGHLYISAWAEQNGIALTTTTSMTAAHLRDYTGADVAGLSMSDGSVGTNGVFTWDATVTLTSKSRYIFEATVTIAGVTYLLRSGFVRV